MPTYAIGDLQGCLDEFDALLEAISFSPKTDVLWLVGDLVNRGAESLGTLRRVRELGDAARLVLGNHDLHFLAVFYGGHRPKRSDTLDDLLAAPDAEELAAWLRVQPLVHHSPSLGWLMVHAGVPPQWTLDDLMERAAEAQRFYAGSGGPEFFAGMYGNTPGVWREDLDGLPRVRCIVNYLTRMRLIDGSGALNFDLKGAPTNLPNGFVPWFAQPRAKPLGAKIAFGHWAALEGKTELGVAVNPETPLAGSLPQVAALDTGCVWGRELTALCLETGERSSVPAKG